MTLCDTGPVVALIDEGNLQHENCVPTLDSLGSEDLITTWPCLTETMHSAYRIGGHPAQERIWECVAKGLMLLLTPPETEWRRVRELMSKYADAPMDLADASLVAAAERLRIRGIFTVDRHFQACRIHDKEAFDIVPAGLAP
jgi:predicted nucleic acid-binding protein